MNERIKELYIQTANETADGKEWAIGGLINAERFAQLIVQECIVDFYRRYLDICSDEDITVQVERYVKEYFGVEE